MLHTPTICQHFLHTAIQPVKDQFPDLIMYHYMDDILIAAPLQDILAKTASFLRNSVASAGLVIAPEKIQHSETWKYLGYILFNRTIWPQVLQINLPKDLTLNRLQQLLGATKWVRPRLGIPTQQLTHLFNTLKRDPDLNSPRKLSPEALQELTMVNQHIQQ